MAPTAADREFAENVSRAVVRLGGGQVQMVVMVGSRAQGRARAESDLDLVVVVELPPGSRPWNGDDFIRAGRGLEAALGSSAVPLDLRVRTTDRFAEASDVPGGVEWLAAHEGIVLFERAVESPPRIRTSKADVARELVSAWVHHALSALETFNAPARIPAGLAHAVVERLIAAILTHLGLVPRLDRDLLRYSQQIPPVLAISRAIQSTISVLASDPSGAAGRLTEQVLAHLCADARQARVLAGARKRLERWTEHRRSHLHG
jgi:predicted nucleotidyltransferase